MWRCIAKNGNLVAATGCGSGLGLTVCLLSKTAKATWWTSHLLSGCLVQVVNSNQQAVVHDFEAFKNLHIQKWQFSQFPQHPHRTLIAAASWQHWSKVCETHLHTLFLIHNILEILTSNRHTRTQSAWGTLIHHPLEMLTSNIQERPTHHLHVAHSYIILRYQQTVFMRRAHASFMRHTHTQSFWDTDKPYSWDTLTHHLYETCAAVMTLTHHLH